MLLGEEELTAVLHDVPAFGLALVPAVPDRLRVAERTLAAQVGSERILAKALRRLDLDIVLIDCPPTSAAPHSSCGIAARCSLL